MVGPIKEEQGTFLHNNSLSKDCIRRSKIERTRGFIFYPLVTQNPDGFIKITIVEKTVEKDQTLKSGPPREGVWL